MSMSDSDTLSEMFMKGKIKILKNFVKDPHIADVVKACNNTDRETQEMVTVTGKRLIFSL